VAETSVVRKALSPNDLTICGRKKLSPIRNGTSHFVTLARVRTSKGYMGSARQDYLLAHI
jgi:hypothetical protein